MLKVESCQPGSLRVFADDTRNCARICHVLANEGCSFYFEPWPNDRARIYVDAEHAPQVERELGPAGRKVWP